MNALRQEPALDLPDFALLGVYLAMAGIGTLTGALLLSDAAVLMSVGWLGNAWDLYLGQFSARALAVLLAYGPAWGARAAFDLGAGPHMALAHALYFALPPGLWLVVRAVEPHRLYSRLYLAFTIILIYFPTEVFTAAGFWTIWLAWISAPGRSTPGIAGATAILGIAIAFTHPAALLMSGTYLAAGLVLRLAGRPLPTRTLWAAAAMTVLLTVAYLVLSRVLPPTNPTVVHALTVNRQDYADPVRALATFALFPMIPAVWLLLLIPGLPGGSIRPSIVTAIGLFGLWFAAAGTGLLTALYARHTAPYLLALALVLAQSQPAAWLRASRAPLCWCAAIAMVAALSYTADLIVFGRYVDRHLTPGFHDVASVDPAWPAPVSDRGGARTWAKWLAGNDYVRDVVVPEYDWYRATLVFYSFYRSNGTSALYHALGQPGDWIAFQCDAVGRIVRRPETAAFVAFLAQGYCVK